MAVSRQIKGSQMYQGGPIEGWLQNFNPLSVFVAGLIVLAGVSFSQNSVLLTGLFVLLNIAALTAYLDLRSVFKLVMLPVLLFALPTWLFSLWWYNSGIAYGSMVVLRTTVSVMTVSVMIHSVGLRNFSRILRAFRLPAELVVTWQIMVSQVFAFGDFVSAMRYSRQARSITPGTLKESSLLVGRQCGVLFNRTYLRGQEIAFAHESRKVTTAYPPQQTLPTRRRDILFVFLALLIFAGLVAL